jgi:hypothetical protein
MPNWEQQYPHKTYTKQDVIDAVNVVSEEVDGDLTKKDYRDERDDSHPSITVVEDRFSSWNDAKKATDEEVRTEPTEESESTQTNETEETTNNQIPDDGSDQKDHDYTRMDCIRAVRNVHESVGGVTLTAQEYVQNKDPNHPSINILSDLFQNWEAVITESGVASTVTRDECIDAIVYVTEELGHPPDTAEYNRLKQETHPSSELIETQYGYWDDALKDADVL